MGCQKHRANSRSACSPAESRVGGPSLLYSGDDDYSYRRGAAHNGSPNLDVLIVTHDRLSITVMLFMAAIGIWGLFLYLRGNAVTGSFAGALVIGELLLIVQVVAGVLLFAGGARPPTATHYLYGVTAILVLPFAWSYFRERSQRQALMIYSLLALFIFGLAIRGMVTGS